MGTSAKEHHITSKPSAQQRNITLKERLITPLTGRPDNRLFNGDGIIDGKTNYFNNPSKISSERKHSVENLVEEAEKRNKVWDHF